MSKELSEMCPLGEKMAKIWLKLQENGKKKCQMAKVMAKENLKIYPSANPGLGIKPRYFGKYYNLPNFDLYN